MNEAERNIKTIKQAIDLLELRKDLCGSLCPTDRMALTSLREKLERDNPQSLTLDELRERDGKPVWVQNVKHPERSRWELMVNAVYSFVNQEYSFQTCWPQKLVCYRRGKDYGKTWLAYDYQPKEG